MTASPILSQSTQSHSSSSSSQPTSKPWLETPLIESEQLIKAAGCRIFLKLDHLQPSNSFKIRGLGHFILKTHQTSPNPSSLHFFSSSGGNAGLAAIYASNFVSRPCTVVVPLSTKPHMIEKLQAAGAKDVIQWGATWKEADNYMREVVMKNAQENEEAIAVPPLRPPGHLARPRHNHLRTRNPTALGPSSRLHNLLHRQWRPLQRNHARNPPPNLLLLHHLHHLFIIMEIPSHSKPSAPPPKTPKPPSQ
ncbi:hypothetical protein BST61_g9855 [Cercospora zeina]